MDCRRFSEKLADAALEPGAVRDASLAAHLETCAVCQRELAAQRRLAGAMDLGLQASVSESPSPAFAAGVRARLAEEAAPRASWFSGWVPVAAGALAVVVLMVAWLARRGGPEPVPGPQREMTNRTVQQPMRATSESNVATLESAQPMRTPKSSANRTPALRAAQRRELEVIVPPGQREAVLRFYVAVWSGRAEISTLLEKTGPLQIAELKITPLQVPELASGSQQPE